MRGQSESSIRVSAATRSRLREIARNLKAGSQQEVIDRALDQVEHRLFWEGFDQEARGYLEAAPEEEKERRAFSATLADVGTRRRQVSRTTSPPG